MKENIGTCDRLIRLFLGVILLLLALLTSFPFGGRILILLVGLFTIYEALVGWCAFYALIGKNTCPIKYD